jgi:hypothetical protein
MAEDNENGPGGGVDPSSKVKDPTKNVLDLVDAAIKRQDDLRTAEVKFQDGMREAEVRRRNDLAQLKGVYDRLVSECREKYETRISEMLRLQVQDTSLLVSKQLDRLTTSFESRISAVEKFQYEVGGKASVSDPAITDALARLAASVNALNIESGAGKGAAKGSDDTWKFIAAVITMILGIGGIVSMVAVLAN